MLTTRTFLNIVLPVISTIVIFTATVIYYDKTAAVEQHSNTFVITKPDITLPDFSRIHDIKLKKKMFFNFMRPHIEEENAKIMLKRKKLIGLFNKDVINNTDILEIKGIAEEYKIDDFDTLDHTIKSALLSRVDIIPVPLALVQAANESAWGTSRFAKLGNNMFGQWCFTKGEGIVPKRRDAGATHEIATFPDVTRSVSSYMQNLNTGESYDSLRKLRAELRQENKDLEASVLAAGLTKYSSLGQRYVKIIYSMLESNKHYL